MTDTTAQQPITARLKGDNWDLHQIAERGGTPEAMIKGTMTKDEFIGYLQQSIHIHRALDNAMNRAVEMMPSLEGLYLEHQAFAEYFAEDLAFYGADEIEASSLIPGAQRFIEHIENHADNPLHIFGLHYVRLGASNGNRFVARKLRQVFEISDPRKGMMSHDPFGENQRPEWSAFKEGLDALELDESQRDELFYGTRSAYVLTINLDHDEFISGPELLKKHGKSLDKEVFEQGHSVHV